MDINDHQRIIQYEQSFFKAFYKIDHAAAKLIWNFDFSGQRISTKVPYQNHEIYIAEYQGEILGPISMNYNLEKQLQLEILRFFIDKKESGIAEGIVTFNLKTFLNSESVIFRLRDYSETIID